MEVVADDHNEVIADHVDESGTEIVNSGDGSVSNPSGASLEEESAQTTNNVVSSSGTPSAETKPLLPLLVPSLKGKMIYEGGNVTCKGVWGMSDFAHTQPGQVSDFEFKLVKADEGSSLFPVNGRYQGWFHLKQAPPLKGSVKIEDKEMVIQFTKSEDSTNYSINGNGLNKFGSFTLKGTLSEDGDLHVYREYYNLTPAPVNLKRRLSIDGAENAPQAKKKPLVVKTDEIVPPPADVSPREGAGRVRKQSSLMKEYIDTTVKTPAPTPKPLPAPKVEKEVKVAKAIAAPAVVHRQESTSDRAQRLSAPLKKCAELLKEMSKHPHAIWFLEPVDHIKLNIPDYPLIVTQPMDFSTIRKRVEGNLYDTEHAFAEDMRLVFRNAINFNTARDNVVHIAAREMSSRFEDRFRVLTTQLGGLNTYSAAAILAMEATKIPGPNSGKKSKTPRSSLGGGGFPKASAAPGPRLSTSTSMPYLPPAVDGSSAHQLLEMQRMMQAMQNEISTLKSQVRENEIVKRLQDSKDASHNPLTFEEKKTLIAQIHKLPADKMPHVLNIIQSALPPRENDEDGDIEVPLDALDTFTLRKLQKFIEDNSEKKKRAPPAAQRHSSASAVSAARNSFDGNGMPKKARKSASTSKISGMSPVNGLDLQHANELELFESSEDMLFEPDSFEELKAHAQDAARRDHNSNNTAGDDDEEDFSALIGMNHAASSGSSEVQINNLDAWK